MATTIVISCPECKKQFKGPSELQGKRIKCKACSHIFVVKTAAAKTNPAPKAAPAAKSSSGLRPEPEPPRPDAIPDLDDDRNPYRVTTVDLTPRCPFCAHEMESADALICLNCGYNFQTRSRHATKRTVETTSADYFQWWLPAFVCIFGILFLIGWNFLFILVIAPALREDSVFFIVAAGWARVWQAIISAFLCFFMGKFAVQRLILHPTPPEKELD